MEFYRVKSSRGTGSTLQIGNELITKKEFAQKTFGKENLELVNVSKFKTYWCFGARFESSINR